MLASVLSVLGLTLSADLSPASPVPAAPGEWPQWRGPQRDGVSSETGLLKEWPKEGPKLVWTARGAGGGYSAVTIAGGRLFTQGDRVDGEYVIAFDIKDGKELWALANGPIYPNSRGGGPRGSVTVDGELAYALGANGRLVCLEAATGKSRFQIDILKGFQGRSPHWGLSESPLIEKDLLIVTPGGDDATVVALDKRTGKPVWRLKEKDRAAYSSAIAADIAGLRQVVVFTAKGVLGMAAADGKFLWRYDKAANGVANVATPIVSGDQVFVSSAYGSGAALLKLTAAGGGVEATEVYFTKAMKNHHATCVLVSGYLYGFSDGTFTCMEFASGKVSYPSAEERRGSHGVQKGGLVYADGRLYSLGEEGEMALLEANPKQLVVKSRFQPFSMKSDSGAHGKRRNTWAHPVVAGGRLYLRNQEEIYAYDVKAQ
jgi:outer membrane protein assembly factor BamB